MDRPSARQRIPCESVDGEDPGCSAAVTHIHAHGGCHTALIGGYVIEGHVPAREMKRLLAERPQARGLAVAGMPVGSPGMESGKRRDPYDVLLVLPDGRVSVYARYGR